MSEGFGLATLYRQVYGHARNRLGRLFGEQPPDEIRADPLQGLHVDPVLLSEPEARAVVAEAVEDALAGRGPRW